MALKSDAQNYKVGAVIANGSYIIACGRNRKFNNFDKRDDDCRSIHGEIDALGKSRAAVDDCVIYVVVLTQRQNDGLGRPCDRCMAKLRNSGIKTVVYSNRGNPVIEKI